MKKIEDILDQCLEELQEGKSLDQVLSPHPEHTDELRPLLGAAMELGSLPDPEISVHSMMEAMAKLAIEEHKLEVKKYRFFSKPILLRVAAAITILLVVGFGSIAASSNTLPGDFMYPVKLFTEKIRFSLAMTSENEVELRIVFSEERMKEFVRKFDNGEGVDKDVLIAMIDEAKLAFEKSKSLPEKEKALYVSKVANLSHLQAVTLKKMEKDASPEDKATLAECADACVEICGCGPTRACCDSLEKHLRNCPCNKLKQ